ncbi:MAG: asparaginase [Micromonosporaceae bacterium]|nr:asparaginase [Micromonosporaceae bacterium]
MAGRRGRGCRCPGPAGLGCRPAGEGSGAVSGSSGRVLVFGLGGTIAMAATGSGGAVPEFSPAQLLAAVPGLAATGVEVRAEELRRVPGGSVRLTDLYALAGVVRERLAAGFGAAVVTQGTDTIEESAYLLDLLHADRAPVVVTGAMRNPSLAGADGPANLLAAVQVAAAPEARGQGVLVVFNDEIHAARRVRKTHATNPATFGSPDGGPLGFVVEGRPQLVNRLPGRTVIPAAAVAAGDGPAGARPVRVALVTVTLGDDGGLLAGLADRADGLVVAAFGAGHVPEWLVEPLAGLADRIPVVLASRTGAGPVLAATYGFPGSERDLLSRGLVRAGFLGPEKARILLHALLSAGADRATITAAFGAAGGHAPASTWPWPTGFAGGEVGSGYAGSIR